MVRNTMKSSVKDSVHSQFLTPAELRARWAVSNMFLWRARRDGKLPAIKLGRHVRFRIADVERIETEASTH